MQTTKQQILALLKRTGSVTVEEAAGALSLASMTARQHLVGLEKDGVVSSEKVRRPTGRPHYLYSLTPKGNDLFPNRYDLLAQILLEEVSLLEAADIEGLDGDDKRSLVIQRTTDKLTAQFRSQVEGRSLDERVEAVAGVMHLIGGFAEWCHTDEGYEIRDYNCVFGRLGPDKASGCQWHTRLLTGLLHWPARHEHVKVGRSEYCRYLIADNPSGPQAEGLLANA